MTRTIAVTTPTGNVGRRVASELARRSRERDLRIVLLARNAARTGLADGDRVEIREGSLGDDGYLLQATSDADALFLATPHGFPDGTPVRDGYRRIAAQAAAAIRANRIRHTVHLSGFVAVDDEAAEGSMLGGLTDTEAILRRAVEDADEAPESASLSLTHVRAGFFFENLLGQLDNIANLGIVFVPMDTRIRIPMVAARDVARRAVETLLAHPPRDVAATSVLGPADISFREAAAAMSTGLGQRVRAIRLPPALIRMGMLRRGSSVRMVNALLAVFHAAQKHGGLRAVPGRDVHSTTSTTMTQFAAEEMLPLVRAHADAGPMCPARVQ